MARAANTASVEDVCKALRGCCVSLRDSYKDADPNVVCAAYESFIIDTLSLTKRPTKTLLEKACPQAFEGCSSQEASFFGRQIAAAVQHCRAKSKSMSSGAKTSTSVQRIIAALGTTPAGHITGRVRKLLQPKCLQRSLERLAPRRVLRSLLGLLPLLPGRVLCRRPQSLRRMD